MCGCRVMQTFKLFNWLFNITFNTFQCAISDFSFLPYAVPCLKFHRAGNEVLEQEESSSVISASAFQNIAVLCLGIRQKYTVSAQSFPIFSKETLTCFQKSDFNDGIWCWICVKCFLFHVVVMWLCMLPFKVYTHLYSETMDSSSISFLSGILGFSLLFGFGY